MADFLLAIPITLGYEGGWAQVAGDAGGNTYQGLTEKNNPDASFWAFLLTQPYKWNEIFPQFNDEVIAIYKASYWNKILGDQIQNQGVASYLFDWFVTSEGNAVKHVQNIIGVTVDGSFGNDTLNNLNNAGDILQQIRDARVAFYNAIVAFNPSQEKFLDGWLSRANSLYDKLTS